VELSRSTLAAGIDALYEAAFRTGDFDGAEMMLREAQVGAVEESDRLTEAAALDRLGMLMHFRGLAAGASQPGVVTEMDLFQAALTIRREIGDRAGIAESLFGVALVHQLLRNDWDTAMPLFREAMALADEYADDLTRSEIYRHVGFYYVVRDPQPMLAVQHLRTSYELRLSYGDERWIPGGALALGQAELTAGLLADAIDHLKRARDGAGEAGLRGHAASQADEWLNRALAAQQSQSQTVY
jgi:tetratricopeptide (TPR) repeat protein